MMRRGSKSLEIFALARRIEACGHKSNVFIASGVPSQFADNTYDTIGTFWQCGSKLCPSCLARHAQRNRRKLRDALSQQTPRKGERLYFATFTVTNFGGSLTVTRDIVNHAWSMFRKRQLCVSLIRGGSKSEEFTVTANGFHYHLHCLFLSQWLLFQEVRRIWTECVTTAFAEAGVPLEINTSDGMLIVKIKPVTSRERSIQEVCKYVTKSDSWRKMPVTDLAEIALVRRWHRMFELFGSFAPRECHTVADTSSTAPRQRIVHTVDITDGSDRPISSYWRDKLAYHGKEWFLEHLKYQLEASQRNLRYDFERMYPNVTLATAEELGIA